MSEAKKKRISIVVPVFNEEENIPLFYDTVTLELARLRSEYDYEIVFTDNRSTDSSFAKLRSLAEGDPHVKVIRFSKNFGYQNSIYTGFCFATGDAAIQMDCDLQDPPELIHDFIAHWQRGAQVVYGIRNTRKEGWLINNIRKLFYRIINYLSDDNLPLNAGDFRLVDRRVLDQLKQMYDASPYLRGTIAAMGFHQVGIPYDRHKRASGKGKFNLKGYISLAIDGILNHSVVPLRVATFTGFFIAGGLILYFITLVVLSNFFDYPWPKGFATISFLILISISSNALFLGIIGEYLGRIYRQIKGRPMTVIDRTLNVESADKIASAKTMPSVTLTPTS